MRLMSPMTLTETARQIATLRHRMAQVAGLQRQRVELNALVGGAGQPLDLAIQFAKLDSALRIARLALAQILHSLPASERTRFIRVHAPSRPAELPSHDARRGQLRNRSHTAQSQPSQTSGKEIMRYG